MCRLSQKYTKSKTFTGYKIVCVDKNGDYFSPAMGCKYPKRGKVPIVYVQNRLSSKYNEDILEDECNGRDSSMVGKTAVFESMTGAISESVSIGQDLSPGYKIKVVRMTISKELRVGTYGYQPVVGGKYICSIEEI